MKKKYEVLYNNMVAYQNALAANKNRKTGLAVLDPFRNLSKDFASHLITDLSQLPLARNEKGLVSTTDTIKQDNDLTYAAGIAYNIKRSLYAPSSSEFCFLTPYLMWAHKYKNNVMYEEWDKEDSNIERAMGKSLAEILTNKEEIKELWNNHRTPEEVATHRELVYLDKPITGWPRRGTLVELADGKGLKMKAYAPLQKMYLQCWKAHGSLRHVKANILNPLDWDDTPEVYDEVTAIQPQQPQPQPKPSASRDLPW